MILLMVAVKATRKQCKYYYDYSDNVKKLSSKV